MTLRFHEWMNLLIYQDSLIISNEFTTAGRGLNTRSYTIVPKHSILTCLINKISSTRPDTGPLRGMRFNETPVNIKDAGRPLLTHHHRDGWNETKWMIWMWRNMVGWNLWQGKMCEIPKKTYPDSRWVHQEPIWSDRETNSRLQRWEATT